MTRPRVWRGARAGAMTMSDDEVRESYRLAIVRGAEVLELIRLGFLVMYGCSIGMLVAVWPPNVWVWILFALQTIVLLAMFVRYFPMYTLGDAIEDVDEEVD